MKVIILGCGFSFGVPVIACKCSVCLSKNDLNQRMRSSIIISSDKTNILVDFGADIRNQLLKHNIDNIDAVICTHDHADHVAGIDDLKPFGYKKIIDLYSDAVTINNLSKKYKYLFNGSDRVKKIFNPIKLGYYDKIKINDIEIQFFKQYHYPIKSLGIRINNLVYSIDVKKFPSKSFKYLKNIDKWILDCIDYQGTDPHMGLDEIFTIKKNLHPSEVYLTNLSHNLDYDILSDELPKDIKVCFDGMVLKF